MMVLVVGSFMVAFHGTARDMAMAMAICYCRDTLLGRMKFHDATDATDIADL